MIAVFRDNTGAFTLDNVENIQWNSADKKWSIMFDDYEVMETDAQIVEVQN